MAKKSKKTKEEAPEVLEAKTKKEKKKKAKVESTEFASEETGLDETSLDEIVANLSADDEAKKEEETTAENSSTVMDLQQLEQALEALIFASPKPLSLQRITRIFKEADIETEELKQVLDGLVEGYKERGLQIVKVGKSYQFRTHPDHGKLVQKLVEDKPARLSQSALEVLAIVAYKQPIVRAEIDAVRGIDSGHLMKGLLEKNLVRTDGHAEAAGRPLLYVTSPYFLEVFNLDSLDELPSLEEFQRELGEGQSSEGVDAADQDGISVLDADPDFYDKHSPLAANPDRGDFDTPAEDEIILPDFESGENDESSDAQLLSDAPMAEA